MELKDFWFIAAESHEVKDAQPFATTINDEWLVLFRNESGQVTAMQDRCLHRNAKLSAGKVAAGQLTCPYHGWTYDGQGAVISVPSEGPKHRSRCAPTFAVREQDDYIYVQLSKHENVQKRPFEMPCFKKPGYTTIRLQNTFENTVTNCVENFLDIPHTTFVHPKIFRNSSKQPMRAQVRRQDGHVKVTYLGEKSDFGIFSWFLNPRRGEITHTDEFFMPNVSTVNYWFGKKHFIITSQSVPVSEFKTKVFTDLTYNYGWWNWISKPVVRRQGQAIIDQDIEILKIQGEVIKKYGSQFQNSPSDIIHTFIESIQNEILCGRDPLALPEKETEVEFWV